MQAVQSVPAKRPALSIVLYVAGALIALAGIAVLVSNVLLFRAALAQYVAQGFSSSQVASQLIPSQLLPGIFEPIAIYGGIALMLIVSGLVLHKTAQCLGIMASAEIVGVGDEVAHEDPDRSGVTDQPADRERAENSDAD